MVAWLGPAISAGANLIGGLMGASAQKDANERNQAAWQQNFDMQKKLASHGIRMRVEDAKEAGIHPLYALGAPTMSWSGQSLGSGATTGVASGLAAAGQDLSRAFNATRTMPERMEATAATKLQLEGMQLDNDIKRATLASSIARLNQASNPPIPATGPFAVPEKNKAEERQPLMMDGNRVLTDPGTSPGNAWEDQLGDDIFSPGFLPNLIGMIKRNTEGMSFVDILRALDRKTAITTFPSLRRHPAVVENYW